MHNLRRKKAQESVELFLVMILIFFIGLFAMITFGNKILAFFSNESSAVKTYNTPLNTITPGNKLKYEPNYDTKIAENIQPTNNSELIQNSDGTFTLNTRDQQILIPPELISALNSTTQTTGASSLNDLITEINNLIDIYKADNPNAASPVEVNYGKGQLISNTNPPSKGEEVNVTTITIGDHVIILEDNSTVINRIEGISNAKDTFKASLETALANMKNTHSHSSGHHSHHGNANTQPPPVDVSFTQDKASSGKASIVSNDWKLEFFIAK